MRSVIYRVMLYGMLLAVAACSRAPEELSAVGTLEWDRIELSTDVSEPIVAIAVREGQQVNTGQVIVQLDAQRIRAQVAAAQAARDQAAAQLAEQQRGPRVERIDAARAQAVGAQNAWLIAQREYVRKQTLAARKLIAPQELDLARAQRDSAQAAHTAARAALDEALAGATREQLDQARAALLGAEAQLRAQQLTLDRLTIRAPQPGRIDALPFHVGERPKAGAVLAVLLGGKAPYARVYVPEPLRARLTPGHAAQVYVDGIATAFAAHLRSIDSDPAFTPYFALNERDRSRLSYFAKVELRGKDIEQLPAGAPVRVEFAK